MQIVCLDTPPVAKKPKKQKRARVHGQKPLDATAMFTSFMLDYMSSPNKGAADPSEIFAQFMAKQAKEMKGNLIVRNDFH